MNSVDYEFIVTWKGINDRVSVRNFGYSMDCIRYIRWLIKIGGFSEIKVHITSLKLTILPLESKGYETWLINL